jgi:hypothetical protein
MDEKVDLAEKLALIDEHFRPKIVAAFNDHEVELVKVKGEFVWHSHAQTDDLFSSSRAASRSNSVSTTLSSAQVSCSSCRAGSRTAPARMRRLTSC